VTTDNQLMPSIEQVTDWLAGLHDAEISDFVALSGGFWSSAYAYRVGSQALVLRLSDMAEGFAIDRAAMRFKGPNLPVPNVVDTGKALGLNYAISERHYGRFIETTTADEGHAVGYVLETLLAALRAVPTTEDDRVVWYDQEGAAAGRWHDWLMGGLVDNPDVRVSGWRAKLAEIPVIDALFERCVSRIHKLLPVCPERRDLIHGDLLHQNVLVSGDASRVTAVFSWKCSAFGDFLYDVAWCTFWGGWHPGIAAADIWNRTLAAPDLTAADLEHASVRHHCFELQIGASHLGWNAWTGNQKELKAVANALERTLANGPLPRTD
jgi:aminoglycoside phosphotransferase (APT) family kinase protein